MYRFRNPNWQSEEIKRDSEYRAVPIMDSCCGCDCCNKVVHQYQVVNVPEVVNVNTHVINHCIRRHITIPRYTTSYETVYSDEYFGCCNNQENETR